MHEASGRLTAEERAALEARYWAWFYRTLDEDRLDTAPVPAEFAALAEPPGA